MPSPRVSTLERLRLERGLSRLQVQHGVPLNRKTLWHLEQMEVVEPRALTIQKLARFYGVRPEWLMLEYRRDREEFQFARAA